MLTRACVTQLLKGRTNQCWKCLNGHPEIRSLLNRYSTDSSVRELHHLKSRGLIQMKGKDVIPFLQGLVTNDVELLGPKLPAQYTMLLNVQGRVMYDLLLYNIGETDSERNLLLECDETVVNKIITDIKKYKLRKKVTIDNVSDTYKVFASSSPISDVELTGHSMVVSDPRVPEFGTRVISKNDVVDGLTVIEEESEYHKKRLQWGIPEGVLDLPPGNCLPLESNLVYMNGVSFSKGCYLGQELTARTQHTGVTRKRLMPLFFERPPPAIEPGQSVHNESKKNVGKYRSCCGNIGLALLRFADVGGELKITAKSGETVICRTVKPHWWPQCND